MPKTFHSAEILLGAMIAVLPAAKPALAHPPCTIIQISHSASGESRFPSLDGGSIAFESSADLTGDNPERGREVFLFDGSKITQITHSGIDESFTPSLSGSSIAFPSNADLTGGNPDGNFEIFLFNGSAITQITHSTSSQSFFPSLDGGSIAFESNADLTGGNPVHQEEVFLFQGSTIIQVTGSTGSPFRAPSLDAGAIALISSADLTGNNPDHSEEIFLFDGSTVTQITDHGSTGIADIASPSLDGGSIAFISLADLTGDNPDASDEVFLFDGSAIRQITDSAFGSSTSEPSLEGGSIAFASNADLTGGNPDLNQEIFLFDGSATIQVTNSTGGDSSSPSLDGGSIAFASTANLTGDNPDASQEIFLASCDGQIPPPPPGPYLTSNAVPGFRFKVRIASGGQVIAGRQEAGCIGETLCVSGALAGRSELFLRIIGPRPNGFLWLSLVRFTTSRVEVWAEQINTRKLNYYSLPALPPADTELTGKLDKEAFLP